uniref:Uncharacterized protein n=1 Tax=Dermatophagoides pteronyssinus TaxID=6956 RepID=A0A6P6XQ35_DERPT|nr:putative uncharacterized protein DDB_G0277255 [Dermatophagoides pteronyssinus]XP_027195526.1 putative uncharacterized protein DDB_G0277255 [Dermatophagoides pteronyssinus]
MAEISKNEASTTATNSQLKCKCYKLYIETMSMEIDSKLLYQLNNEHLQKRRSKIESYQNSFVEIQLSLLTIENFDTIDPIENDHSLLKMLTTIGKTLNSMLTMIDLAIENRQQQQQQQQKFMENINNHGYYSPSIRHDIDRLELISQFGDNDDYDDDSMSIKTTDCRSVYDFDDYHSQHKQSHNLVPNDRHNFSMSLSNLKQFGPDKSIRRFNNNVDSQSINGVSNDHILSPSSSSIYLTPLSTFSSSSTAPIANHNSKLNLEPNVSVLGDVQPEKNDQNKLTATITATATTTTTATSKTSQPSTSSSTLSKPNSTTTTTTKKMQNNQDFIFTFKQIIKQIDTIPTNSSETKHLDYLSAKIHNLPINNMERMDLMVDELYRLLIESIYMNNFPLYLKLLFRILNISVKRPPQPQQQNGQQQSPQQQQQQNGQITKYSIRDSLMKKCDQIFFNKQQQQSNNSSFKMDANYSLTMEKLESYGCYLFETIVSERRNYLANIRLMSQLFRNNSFDQKRLYPYLKYLIIDNVGVHFYLECFIIMIVGIGVGPLSGLYKQKNWTIRYEIFNRFCLNKYHNLDQSIRNAAQFICQLEKRCWKL